MTGKHTRRAGAALRTLQMAGVSLPSNAQRTRRHQACAVTQ